MRPPTFRADADAMGGGYTKFAVRRSIPPAMKAFGRRGWTRTSDPQLRRLMLYPPELRARSFNGNNRGSRGALRRAVRERSPCLTAAVRAYDKTLLQL